MPEENSHHHFLLETRSQRMHREEAMRRRRELLDKESKKLPVMRFGSAPFVRRSNSKSVSPTPHLVASPSKAFSEIPQSVPSANSMSRRSRPQSREPSRHLLIPSDGKSVAPDPVKKHSVSLARSYRSSPAVSRVASPVPVTRAREDEVVSRSLKRLKSRSKTGTPKKHRRLSQPRTNNAHVGDDVVLVDRKPPFISVGSPTGKTLSPFKRLASCTPPPTVVANSGDQRLNGDDVSTFPVTGSTDVMQSISPFALPRTLSAPRGETMRTACAMSAVVAAENNDDEGLVSFCISEFRMPRTSQRRSGIAMHSCSPPPSHITGDHLEVGAECVSNFCEPLIEVPKEYLPPTIESETNHLLIPKEETSHTISVEVPTPPALEKELSSTIDCTMPPNGNEGCFTGDILIKECTTAATSTINSDAVTQPTPVTVDVSATVENETTAVSALSSHAYECSSTTDGSDDEDIEATGPCQLIFELDEENESTKDNEANYGKKDICEKPEVKECVFLEIVPNVNSEVSSQNFYDCIRTPSTPILQLPETYRQLEATRREMTTNTVYQRHQRCLEKRSRRSGRGSLVLVSGDLPVPYTPFLQEPHTPLPLSPPKQHSSTPPPPQVPTLFSQESHVSPLKDMMAITISSDRSPLPRPVTLQSQVSSSSPSSLCRWKKEPHKSVTLKSTEGRSTPYPKKPSVENATDARSKPADGGSIVVEGEEMNICQGSGSRVCSVSVTSRKSEGDFQIENCLSEAREKTADVVATILIPRILPGACGSGKISDVLSDASFISQSVVMPPQRDLEDHTQLKPFSYNAMKSRTGDEQQGEVKSPGLRYSDERERSECDADLPLSSLPLPAAATLGADEDEEENVVMETKFGESRLTSQRLRGTLQRTSHSLQRRRLHDVRVSLRRFMSRKNRARYLLLQRRLARRRVGRH